MNDIGRENSTKNNAVSSWPHRMGRCNFKARRVDLRKGSSYGEGLPNPIHMHNPSLIQASLTMFSFLLEINGLTEPHCKTSLTCSSTLRRLFVRCAMLLFTFFKVGRQYFTYALLSYISLLRIIPISVFRTLELLNLSNMYFTSQKRSLSNQQVKSSVHKHHRESSL